MSADRLSAALADRYRIERELGQVAPLAASPGEEEHRVDYLPAVDPGRRTPAAWWVEQVGDKAPIARRRARC